MAKSPSSISYFVLVDTNALWLEDKGPMVNPEFDACWEENSKIAKIKLIVPEVVQGELLFQHTTSALKALQKAEENLEKVSQITKKDHVKTSTEEVIKTQIKVKFESWLKSKNGQLECTPISSIDWSTIQDSAIWRTNVFEPTQRKKDKGAEKGFRDRLILETFVSFAKNINDDKNHVCILCFDAQLRKSTELLLADSENISFHENIEHFNSYLKLAHEKLTEKFIDSIMLKATQVFFQKDQETSLYYSEKIFERIYNKFKNYFEIPEKSRSSQALSSAKQNVLASALWEKIGTGGLFIHPSEFIQLNDEGKYCWINKITRTQQYTKRFKGLDSGLNYLNLQTNLWTPNYLNQQTNLWTPSYLNQQTNLWAPSQEKLTLEFTIHWSALVSEDSLFSSVQITNIEMSMNEFRPLRLSELA